MYLYTHYVYKNTYTDNVYICMYILLMNIYNIIYICMCVCVCMYMYIHIDMHIYTYIYNADPYAA